MEKAIAVGVSVISPSRIDEINIYQASKEAMIKAINSLTVKPQYVLSDAMPINELDIETIPIIKGDAKSASIAAASIIAKVTRDHIMLEYDKQYPEYGFKNHKGYPTKEHLEAINKYGILEIHRKTYGPVRLAATKQLSMDI